MKRKTKIDIDDLIDFSSKLVNSNSSVGIRLSSGAALALPYLSTRTCLAAGISMPLDTANGAKDVGKVSALYKKLEEGEEGEKADTEAALKKIRKTGFARKTESVDRRIRQLLIPKDVPSGYVSLSPLPSIGLSVLLLGAVTRHNQDVFSKKKEGIKIRRAHLALGGANPQNLGYAASKKAIQYPVFLSTPKSVRGNASRQASGKGTYLILSNLFVQTANILTNYTMLNGAPLFAAWGMGHALEREMHGPKVTGVCLVVHSIEPLGEHETAIFEPSQRLGAAFTFEKSRNGSDYAKGSTHLSLQPGATGHIRVSLIFELSEALHSVPNAVDLFLNFGKFSGGLITSYDAPALHDDRSTLLECIPAGKVVLDRRDVMSPGNPIEQLVTAIGTYSGKWLSATNIGFSAITDFQVRGGARNGCLHAFAEPLIGITEYVSTEKRIHGYFWRSQWEEDSFLMRGDSTNE
ncbi:type I-F CRISPR-associated protein Csy2 [Bilophila wadsworthia]|uniref:type I-F CRISPR-associated protein Csy2 n=1 Tax=Bilophila wadsworthia TaxID=35833 RepID=UPI003A88A11B